MVPAAAPGAARVGRTGGGGGDAARGGALNAGWRVLAPEPADGATTGDDRAILEGYLGFQRTTLLNVCAGLTPEQLAARPLASTGLSLQGIVRHLAKVERIWLVRRAAGHDEPDLYGGPGDPADFRDTDPATAADEVAQLQWEWAAGDAAVAGMGFDEIVEWRGRSAAPDEPPERWSLRMVYVHLIGEYARHNGHADLLREAIDGVTGR